MPQLMNRQIQPQIPPQVPPQIAQQVQASNGLPPVLRSLVPGEVRGTPEQTNYPKALPAEGTGGMNPTLKQFLLRMGVPLGAAIAGTFSDAALPAAAGLATGYNEGFNRQEDIGVKKDMAENYAYTFDPDTGEFKNTGIKLNTKSNIVRNLTSEKKSELTDAINALIGEYSDEPSAATQSLEKTKASGRVSVISPDGQEGDIPAEQLEEALKSGYRQAK